MVLRDFMVISLEKMMEERVKGRLVWRDCSTWIVEVKNIFLGKKKKR